MCTKNGSYCENKNKKSQGGGVRRDVYKEWKLLPLKEKKLGGGGGGGGGGSRKMQTKISEAFVKIQKNFFFFFGGGGVGWGGGGGSGWM